MHRLYAGDGASVASKIPNFAQVDFALAKVARTPPLRPSRGSRPKAFR